MARVHLIDPKDRPEFSELLEKIRAGRRGRVINVYRALLHAPPLVESWFFHSNTIRWKVTLPGRLREIAIIRVSYLTKATYILNQHVPKLALADGVSLEECEALRDWQHSAFFSASEHAALAYTDAMTRDIEVPDDVYAEVERHFDTRQVVELTVLIGSYSMNARVLTALKLDLEPPAT